MRALSAALRPAALWALFFLSLAAHPAAIRFPDEELARETVLPVFDPVRATLRRNITLKYRFALSGGATFGMDEPFYSVGYAYGEGRLSFYLTELMGLSLQVIWIPPVLSGNGKKLRDVGAEPPRDGRGERLFFDAQRLPYPHLMTFLNFQYTPFYGKISLAKQLALNLSIYARLGPGLIIMNESAKLPAFNFGIGQNFYLTRFLAFNTDVGFYSFHGPDPARAPLAYPNKNDPPPPLSYSDLKPEHKSLHVQLTAHVGFVILL